MYNHLDKKYLDTQNYKLSIYYIILTYSMLKF